MEYNKKKDRTPVETVEKIKDILKGISIDSLTEIIFQRKNNEHCVESLRLHLPEDYYCGTNGKGTTLEFAKASAYAEFMERIQNPYIIRYLPYDNKKISSASFLSKKLYNYFLPEKLRSQKKYIDRTLNIANSFSNSCFLKNIDVIPFYYLNENKVVYLPQKLKWYCAITTGCCAGNTSHEALVEGLCEIFERYVQTKVIMDGISLPDIPRYVYMKYSKIRKIVEHLESLGFNVSIKDASFNGEYPVALSIVSTPDGERYFATFGSHPSLPIAIERCFTETMQGADISDNKIVEFYFRVKKQRENNLKFSKYDNAIWHRYIEFTPEFFTKETNYTFDENSWLDVSEMSNKEIFKLLINKLLDKKMDVFIRDVNFLGFNAFRLYIPQLNSHYHIVDDLEGEDYKYQHYKCDRTFKHETKLNLSKEELDGFFTYIFHLKTKYSHNDYRNLELYYVLLLINMQKEERALNILNTMKNKSIFNNKKRIINLLIAYLENKDNKDRKQFLLNTYSKYAVKKMYKYYLSTSTYKNIVKAMSKRKTYYEYVRKTGVERKQELIKILLKKYKENCPNQMNVSKIFE